MTFKTPNIPRKRIKCNECNGNQYIESESQLIITPCEACEGKGYQYGSRELSGHDGYIYMYIDQNVISDKRDGRYRIPDLGMFDMSQRGRHRESDFVVYVYSNETLFEIANSKYPEEYLSVLKTLKAHKLLESIDSQIPALFDKRVTITGKLQPILLYFDPKEIYWGFFNHLDKKRRYLQDVITYAKMVLHVESFLKIKKAFFDFVNLEKEEKLKELSCIVNSIRDILGTSHSGASKLSAQENPIEEIWKSIVSQKVISPDITVDMFFGFGDDQGLCGDIINPHLVLNIIGYYPDANKKITSNISGFMSDVRHVNMASRTDVFLTYDRNLAHRASALYKWKDAETGYHLMTVFKRFGKNDVMNYISSEEEIYDQASDRWRLFYTNGRLSSAN